MADKMTQNASYGKTVTDERIGTVRGRTVTQYSFDVSIDGISDYDAVADEYLITVNGRVIKRMNDYQAKRMGLIK